MKPSLARGLAAAALASFTATSFAATSTITVSGYKGASALADFPALVRISESNIAGFKYSQCGKADGSDVWFADADGNAIPSEIDTWNADGESAVWVRLPSLANGTTFTMHWGEEADGAAPSAASTWDGYVGVWHLGEESGTCANSTSLGAAMDATPAGNGKSASVRYSGTDAPVGAARTTSSSSSSGTNGGGYLSVPSYDDQNVGGSFTISAWVRMSGESGAVGGNRWPRLFSRRNTYNAAGGWETQVRSGSYTLIDAQGGVYSADCTIAALPSTGLCAEWRHIAYVFDDTKISIYGDGSLLASGKISAATDNGNPLSIGSNSNGSESCLMGSFDECRLMRGAASADWVAAEFATVKDADFLSYGMADTGDSGALAIAVAHVKAFGDNYADVTVGLSGLGDGAKSATVKVLCGNGEDELSEAVTTNVAERGLMTLRVRRLLPSNPYVIKVTVVNDKGEEVSAPVISLVTASSPDMFLRPGLFQTFYPKTSQTWNGYLEKPTLEAKDWTRYTDADRVCRRELGPIMAYSGGNPPSSKYVSEVWGDEVYWPENGGTWVYWGLIRLEAGTRYSFRMCIDDYKSLAITAPDGTVTTLIANTVYNAVATSAEYVPETSGYYPVEIRMGDGSGGLGGVATANNYVNTTNMGYSADGGETWSLMLDPGDASLLAVEAPEASVTASERFENGAWKAIDLAFGAADEERTLTAVWGSVHGGALASGWEGSATVPVAAGATTVSFDLPEEWGEDGCLVIRFLLGKSQWSKSVYWRELDAPVVSSVSLDGSGGDTLKVSGSLTFLPGESCALTVLTGTSPDALTQEWTGLEGSTLTSTGDFEFTLFERDTESERYFAPGTNYYACVVATADGKSSQSSVASVKTASAATVTAAGVGVNRKFTVSGIVKTAGMGGDSSVSLWVNQWKNGFVGWKQSGEAVKVGANGSFTLTHTFEEFNCEYFWHIRAVNVSAGGTATAESKTTEWERYTPRDVTAYTWSAQGDGTWGDSANWTDDRGGDCIGYPSDGWSTAVIPAGAKARIALDAARVISALDVSAGDIDVTLAQGGASTNATLLKIWNADKLFGGNGSRLTLDNVAVYTPGRVSALGAGDAVVISNGSDWLFDGSKAGFTLTNGATLKVSGKSKLALVDLTVRTGRVEIDDSLLTVTGWLWYDATVKVSPFIRFAGRRPVMRFTCSDAAFFSGSAARTGDVHLSFSVPTGGYEEPPVQATGTSAHLAYYDIGQYTANPFKVNLNVSVESGSPAALSSKTTETTLIDWRTAGICPDQVTLGDLPGKGSAFSYGEGEFPTTLGVKVVGAACGFFLIVR